MEGCQECPIKGRQTAVGREAGAEKKIGEGGIAEGLGEEGAERILLAGMGRGEPAGTRVSRMVLTRRKPKRS